jgi:hypothetical protein
VGGDGLEPPTSLQRISAARCLSRWWTWPDSNRPPRRCDRRALPIELTARGAWGRFRAHLSASSGRRFHQISFPGELERSGGIEPLVGSLATSCSAIELRPRGGAWSESNHLPEGTAFTARRRHQPVLTCTLQNWLRARKSNPAVPAYETGRVTRPLPAIMAESRELESHTVPRAIRFRSHTGAPVRLTLQAGGRRRSRSEALSRPPAFQAGMATRPFHLPKNWRRATVSIRHPCGGPVFKAACAAARPALHGPPDRSRTCAVPAFEARSSSSELREDRCDRAHAIADLVTTRARRPSRGNWSGGWVDLNHWFPASKAGLPLIRRDRDFGRRPIPFYWCPGGD